MLSNVLTVRVFFLLRDKNVSLDTCAEGMDTRSTNVPALMRFLCSAVYSWSHVAFV